MAEKAIQYVQSFRWCIEVHDRFFGDGYGGIVALFLLRVTIRGVHEPEWIWVVVGDIPSAYMEFDVAPSPQSALLRYIEGVEEWLAATEVERSSGDLIPIDVPPGDEFIEMLKTRMEVLRSSIFPHLRES
ncbi:MAG: hypothetical protein ABSE46_14780 [Terracidiphilus sp.]|jgi:hypothetical protein